MEVGLLQTICKCVVFSCRSFEVSDHLVFGMAAGCDGFRLALQLDRAVDP